MKKILSLTLAVLMMLSCVGASAANWKVGTNAQPSHNENLGMKKFLEEMETLSGGKITGKVYDSASLGDHLERLESLRAGTLEISTTSVGYMAQYLPELAIFDLPYVFESAQHMYDVFYGDCGAYIDSLLNQHGFKVLGYFDFGCRQMINKVRPITAPADLNGVKIRVQETAASIDGLSAMGATATPLAFSEVYLAMQQGVIDGAENSMSVMYASKYFEQCKYLSLTNHLFYSQIIVMSLDLWNSLSEEEQGWVAQAMDTAILWQRGVAQEEEASLRQSFVEAGCDVNEVDQPAFEAACATLFDAYLAQYGEIGRNMFDYIQAAKG